MRRDKKRNKIIIFILIGIVCMMGVGYAAFQTQLDIKGSTEISSDWNIRIISAEVSDTGGSGENVKNTYTDLTANLEANLYSKGDYVEYRVIVENAGTFDAKLDTLGITNSNNEAVKITSTGLVKGQTLYKGETATLTVRIEYNSNYEGNASGTSGETTIDLGFVQNSEGTIVPTTDHLVTYDYTTNGGESTNAENEYVAEGTSINLSYTATKKNYEFKGWNTNAQAAEGLSDLTMGTEDITLYAIFESIDTTRPIIESINTTSTTHSITAVVIASDEESGISKYEFSIDGGKTWIDNGVSNTYTFTGLTQGTSFKIDVRVTNGVDMSSSSNTEVTTSIIENPTFIEQAKEDGKIVIITYPSGCGSTYICSYQKDGGSWAKVTTATQTVMFTTDGTLVAKVSDGTNEASGSYTVIVFEPQNAGIITSYAGNDIPDGYLLCDGSEVSRTAYSELFSKIGTTYGSGNGSTTFNLPDLRGRVVVGSGTADSGTNYTIGTNGGEETHTLTVNEIPSHSHSVIINVNVNPWSHSVADSVKFVGTQTSFGESWLAMKVNSSGGNAAHNNMMPYTTVNYIISTGELSKIENKKISGIINVFGNDNIPDGYLLCDGREVSRTTYSELFSVIGTTYGDGNGSTTFNLPDLRGRVTMGSGNTSNGTNYSLGQEGGEEQHTLSVNEMASHSHQGIMNVNINPWSHSSAEVVSFAGSGKSYGEMWQTNNTNYTSTGGSAAHNNMQPYTAEKYAISTGEAKKDVEDIAGAITAYHGEKIPEKFLLCDGSEVSRTAYSELFSAIGTTYGDGNGSTTFNLPNLSGRVVTGVGNADSGTNYSLGQEGGEEAHTLTVNEMPRHSHQLIIYVNVNQWSHSSSAEIISYASWTTSFGESWLSGKLQSTGGSKAHNNMQPYTIEKYIISKGN